MTTVNDVQNQTATTATEAPTATPAPAEAPAKKRRGFACIDPDRRREIASKGGKAAHAAGTAHQFSSEEAKLAGKKGGTAPHVSRGTQKKPAVDQ